MKPSTSVPEPPLARADVTVQRFLVRHAKRVIKDYGSVIVGVGLTRLLTFLASAMLARRLGVSNFGAYAFAYSITLLVGQLPGTLDSSFVRHYAMTRDERERSSFVRSHLWIKLCIAVVLAMLAIAAFFLVTPDFLSSSAGRPLLLAAVLAGCAYSVVTTGLSYQQARERFVRYSVTSFLINLVGLLALITYVLNFRPTPLGGMLAFNTVVYAAAAIATVGWLVVTSKGAAALRSHALELLRFSGWLVPAGICYIVLTRIDILLLGSLGGGRSVGLYGAALTISTVITLFTSTLPVVFVPKAARSLGSKRELRDYLVQASLVSIGIVGLIPLAVALSPWLLRTAFGADYVAATTILRVLLIGQAFIAIEPPLTGLAYAAGRTKLVFGERLLELAIAILGCVILIPRFSAVGAAYAVAVAYLAGSLVMGVVVSRTIIAPVFRKSA